MAGLERVVGARIASIRLRVARSQRDFGRLLGVSRSAVSAWESGRRIGEDDLRRIAETTCTSFDWLSGGASPGRRAGPRAPAQARPAEPPQGSPPPQTRFRRERVLTDDRPPDPVGPAWSLQPTATSGQRNALIAARPSAHCLRLPGATLVSGERSASYRLIARDGLAPPQFLLSLVLRGRRRIEQGGRECEGGDGCAAFASNADDGRFRFRPDGRYLALFVPAESLLRRAPGMEARLLRAIDPMSPPLRLLAAYVAGLMKASDGFDAEEAAAVADHLADLCALLLGASGSERALALARGLPAAQRAAIRAAIDAGAATPGFSAHSVADLLGVSLRQVHFLLEEDGEGFGRRVTARRLDAARARLADPKFDRMTIPEIASACGFVDLPQFHRKFGARFGEQAAVFRGRGRES